MKSSKEKIVNRKLAAIASADVAGYSRLMNRDEEGTLAALKSHIDELIEPEISQHNGRIVKTTGDGILMEFSSAVAALACCLGIQRQMQDRNHSIPSDRQIQFRIGVNLGDIIVDNDDIFGDGVNVAARLEAMAAPGGICASRSIIEQVRSKISVQVEDLGKRALKNIEEPVHAYQIVGTGTSSKRTKESIVNNESEAELQLPQRPEVAILPFRNINGDKESDYIADGIGLGIQTLLVQLSGLFLINASSDQAYRDGRKSAKEVIRDLPVRYTIEGSAQHAGNRVRVSVQLTDQHKNNVIWAEKYDRDLEDVFALQDDITREVISSLNVQLLGKGFDQIATQELVGDGAWEYFLRGISHMYKLEADENERAREMFEKIYDLSPHRVEGPSYIALTHWLDSVREWSKSSKKSLELAGEWATRAIDCECNIGLGHVILGYIRLHQGHHQEALELCETAIEFRANCPAALGQIAAVKLYCGDAQGAVKSAREALSVRAMYSAMLVNILAMAYRDEGSLELAISTAKEASTFGTDQVDALTTLCSSLVLAEHGSEAREVAAEIVAKEPSFRISKYSSKHPYRAQATHEFISGALAKAGLSQ